MIFALPMAEVYLLGNIVTHLENTSTCKSNESVNLCDRCDLYEPDDSTSPSSLLDELYTRHQTVKST